MVAKVLAINENTIIAAGLENSHVGNLVRIGKDKIFGEIVSVSGKETSIQAYEDTNGIRINDEMEDLNEPLSIELGPGLLTNIFDGLGRRLSALNSNFIARGATLISLDRQKKWSFKALKKKDDTVESGDVLGEVKETALITTKILVPPGVRGKIIDISSGEFTVNQNIAELKDPEGNSFKLNMIQKWPVRMPRPFRSKLNLHDPLLTGQRVFDTLFPIAKGGTVALPGGFGVGKTFLEHAFAKFSNTDISIYVGCGERGNEMAEVLNSFPSVLDPHSGKSIMNKMVLIANTSNMPIIAREASIFTGITIAEFYRDMGYSVLLTADSTSRWAEALRELGSEMGEMPVEEGFPSSLFSSLAAFYSRAGVVDTLGTDKKSGSVTIIGAISPPGGDFSEPVTQTTARLADSYIELDSKLAGERHYPPVNWTNSYSPLSGEIQQFYKKNIGPDFFTYVKKLLDLLHESDKINEIASIVGREALPDKQAAILRLSDIAKLFFLQQNAFDEEDAYTPIEITYKMMNILTSFIDKITSMIDSGAKYSDIKSNPIWERMSDLKHATALDKLEKDVNALGMGKTK